MACITSKISLVPSYLVDPFAMLDLSLETSSESQGGRSFLTQAMLAWACNLKLAFGIFESASFWRPSNNLGIFSRTRNERTAPVCLSEFENLHE
jgi:hypothetical protein